MYQPGSESEESEPAQEPDSDENVEEELAARTEALNMLNNLVPDAADEDEEIPGSIPSQIEHVKITQAYIDEIKKVTLENGKLDPPVIERLQNPDEEQSI